MNFETWTNWLIRSCWFWFRILEKKMVHTLKTEWVISWLVYGQIKLSDRVALTGISYHNAKQRFNF
jgi:hypothetical protein